MAQQAASRTSVETPIAIDLCLEDIDPEEVHAELRSSLLETPRRLPSKYFYDDRGSRLFEQICELPEYYQTRTEKALLMEAARPIVASIRGEELVELGAGAATKTRVLLDAMDEAGCLELYVPLDVSEGTVRRVAEELAGEYPGLRVHGVVADFMKHLDVLPAGGPRLIVFLGGTIGNLDPDSEAVEFLRAVAAQMNPGDSFLLGTDLVKDQQVVERAYNDSQGITAEFNRNILRVVNDVLEADFDPTAFTHRAFYNPERHWIEMRLVSVRRQVVRLTAVELVIELGEGEEILTELSAKYDRPAVERLLARSGLEMVEWFTDPEELFALSLAKLDTEAPHHSRSSP